MDKHEGVIRNKLEGFSCEPCHARFYRLHDGGGFIDGAAESWKHHILGTIYCYSLSLIRVILSLKRSRYLSLLTIHQYQWWIDFTKPKQIESKNKRKNEKNATDKVQCIKNVVWLFFRLLQGNTDSWIRETFACRIRNPGLWNTECSSRNPESHWRLESRIQYPGSGIRNPRPGIQNQRLPWILSHGATYFS